MGLSRRFLLKAGAITGFGGALLGQSGLANAKKGRGSGKGKRRSRRRRDRDDDDSPDDLVRFPGSSVTYEPFTQPIVRPRVLGFDSAEVDDVINPVDGTVKDSNADPGAPQALHPYPGSPEASVGSEAVYHGIAPEYARNNPTHKIANTNDGAFPPDSDCQKLAPRYPWDAFDDAEKINEEPWERTDTRNGEVHYALEIRNSRHEWAPGVVTDILAYRDAGISPPDGGASQNPDPSTGLSLTGEFPAPTILARQGQPAVVRVDNQIQFRPPNADLQEPTECSVHLHGDHTPAHSDGYPDFYILPFEKRDYYYPNVGPREGAEPINEEVGGSTAYERQIEIVPFRNK